MTQISQDNKQNYPMIAAFVLIMIGVIFLLRNLDMVDFGSNWWALFILIPIAYSLSTAWRRRRENAGKFPPAARSALIGAAAMTVVMVIFLFGLSWGTMWPAFLIIGGMAMMLRT